MVGIVVNRNIKVPRWTQKAAPGRGEGEEPDVAWGFEYSQRFGPKGAFTGRAQF